MSNTIRISVRLGVFILVDEGTWNEYRKLDFSVRITLAPNGGQQSYPKTMAWLPGASQQRSTTIPLARLLVAIRARMLGEKLDAKGWIVRLKNGDPLDLRSENLEVVASQGQKNTINASWTVNARWDIAEAGGDPKAIFAAKRRDFRATHKPAIKRDPQPPVPPSPRPRKKNRRGKP